MRLYGKDWRKIQDFIKTRTGAQIRSHAQKYFITMQKHEGNLDDCEVTTRGFTERSLKVLLKKIVDVENQDLKEGETAKEAAPLLKAMYVRDVSRFPFMVTTY